MATTLRAVSFLPAFPILTKLLFLLPISAGLFGVLLPALGYFPDLGGNQFHFDIFRQLLEHPALPYSVWLFYWPQCFRAKVFPEIIIIK